jgi:hypothetical protein
MSFKDIAVPLTERGFHVAPLIPKSKRPLKMSHGDHFDAATTDPKQIELWSKQEPDANAALIPDEIFLFLETDSESELKEACKDLPAEIWDTTRVTSGRPDRAYYILRRRVSSTRKVGDMASTASIAAQRNVGRNSEQNCNRVFLIGTSHLYVNHSERSPLAAPKFLPSTSECGPNIRLRLGKARSWRNSRNCAPMTTTFQKRCTPRRSGVHLAQLSEIAFPVTE